MIIVIFFIVSLIGLYALQSGSYVTRFDRIGSSFFISCMSTLVLSVFLLILGDIIGDYERGVETTYIVSTKDNQQIEGSASILHVKIDTKFMYSMYAVSGDGFVLVQIPADEAIIKYDGGDPRIEREVVYPKDTFKNKFLLTKIRKGDYTIYLPPNSIENSHLLDAQ